MNHFCDQSSRLRALKMHIFLLYHLLDLILQQICTAWFSLKNKLNTENLLYCIIHKPMYTLRFQLLLVFCTILFLSNNTEYVLWCLLLLSR